MSPSVCRPKGKTLSFLQEIWGNKFFGKGGRENLKSAKNAERNNESTVTKDNEGGTEPKGKSPSKHQLKSARRAERVSGTVRPRIWTLKGHWDMSDALQYNRAGVSVLHSNFSLKELSR